MRGETGGVAYLHKFIGNIEQRGYVVLIKCTICAAVTREERHSRTSKLCAVKNADRRIETFFLLFQYRHKRSGGGRREDDLLFSLSLSSVFLTSPRLFLLVMCV